MHSFMERPILTAYLALNLQVANQVWLGRWDPKQDREPDKKNPVVFKEYLIAKYERKQWYTEPGEHREEPTAVSTPPTQSKLPGPPKVRRMGMMLLWLGRG